MMNPSLSFLRKGVAGEKSIYLFNPENDLALASGLKNYTPPAAGADMALSGYMLPWWFGGPGDKVLVPEACLPEARRWGEEMSRRFGPGPEPVSAIDGCGYNLVPWGWSAYTCGLFERRGADPASVSAYAEAAESFRRFSHRRTAMRLLVLLGDDSMAEATSWADVEAFAQLFPDFYIKAPWSSSGRGVFRSVGNYRPLAEGIIRRQGSVILQRAFSGVQDFAMLFSAEDTVRFAGYSLFETGNNSYSGNMLLADDEIERYLARWISPGTLHDLRDRVGRALPEVASAHGYRGPMGVDMLVYEAGDGYGVAPCLEINARYTMGFVAHELAKRALRGTMTSVAVGDPLPPGAVELSPSAGSVRFVAVSGACAPL